MNIYRMNLIIVFSVVLIGTTGITFSQVSGVRQIDGETMHVFSVPDARRIQAALIDLDAAEKKIAEYEIAIAMLQSWVIGLQRTSDYQASIIGADQELITRQARQLQIAEKAVKKNWIRRAVGGVVSMIPALAAGLIIGAVAK